MTIFALVVGTVIAIVAACLSPVKNAPLFDERDDIANTRPTQKDPS